jgi:AraC-like DNA-binding protein
VVIEPFTNPGEPDIDHVRLEAVLSAARMIPGLALVPFQRDYTAAVRTLLDRGVTDVADAGLEGTAEAIRPRLAAIHAQPLKQLVEPTLSRFVSTNARTLVRAAAEVTVDGGTAVDLADVFRSTERTMSGWFVREALPQPRRLLAWLRLILGLSLLESPHFSVARAAMAAGYSFDYALRRAARQLLGGSAKPRERTAAEALNAFNAELRTLREQHRKKGGMEAD